MTEVRSSSERTNPTTSPRLTAENPKVDRRGTLISNNWGPLCFRYCVGPVYSGAPFNLLFPHIYMYFFLYFICLGRDASGHVGRDTFEKKKKMNKIYILPRSLFRKKMNILAEEAHLAFPLWCYSHTLDTGFFFTCNPS